MPLADADGEPGALGAAVSERARRLLRAFDKSEPVDAEPVDVFDELDELHDQRVERQDPRWLPQGGSDELVRLVRKRRRRVTRTS